jgi:hypothetical protein
MCVCKFAMHLLSSTSALEQQHPTSSLCLPSGLLSSGAMWPLSSSDSESGTGHPVDAAARNS